MVTSREGAPRRVLIVEDYYVIAQLYRSFVESAGYDVLGPVANVVAALKILDSETPDVALLDLSLGPTLVTPVAHRLRSMGCPFIILTALPDLDTLSGEFRGCQVVEKPADRDTILSALELEMER